MAKKEMIGANGLLFIATRFVFPFLFASQFCSSVHKKNLLLSETAQENFLLPTYWINYFSRHVKDKETCVLRKMDIECHIFQTKKNVLPFFFSTYYKVLGFSNTCTLMLVDIRLILMDQS